MEKTESIKNLAIALSKFRLMQSKINKDGKNPYYKSKYATLSNILEGIDTNLTECDLTFSQFPDGDTLTTIIIHTQSGEYMQASYKIHAIKDDPQQWGSAITYARRYALVSILGLNIDDDDDAERAMKPYRESEKNNIGTPKKLTSPSEFNTMVKKFNKGEEDIFIRAKGAGWHFDKDQEKTINNLLKLIPNV